MVDLHLDSLNVNFGNNNVLSGVQLSIQTGDIIGIIGKNGCGKTTFFRALCGLIRQSTEMLKIDNTFIPKQKRWKYIAYLPQSSFIPKDYTVERMLNLILNRKQCAIAKNHSCIQELLKVKAGSLSGGKRRLVEFVIISSLERQFIFLDEPFAEIDPLKVNFVYQIIHDTVANSKACILTDHDYRSVQGICSKLFIIINGHLQEINNNDTDLMKVGYIPE